MKFNELPKFKKDFKKFCVKYKSLPNDFQVFREIISVVPLGNSKHFNVITRNDFSCIVKARLFCKYLKGSSFRIVYSYFEQEQQVEFIELYFKGDKENEDHERIEEYLKNHQQ